MEGLTFKTAFETACGMEVAEQQASELSSGPAEASSSAVCVITQSKPQQPPRPTYPACHRCARETVTRRPESRSVEHAESSGSCVRV